MTPNHHYYLFVDAAEQSQRALKVLQLVEDTFNPDQLDIVPRLTKSGLPSVLSSQFGVNRTPAFAEVKVVQDACSTNGSEQELVETLESLHTGFDSVADLLLQRLNP